MQTIQRFPSDPFAFVGAFPPHLARQIHAAARLAPAEAFRGTSALLLHCTEPGEPRPAEHALREQCDVDAVHTLRCPVRSWSQLSSPTAGVATWLRHTLRSELLRREPSLIAILDRASGEPGALRASPIVALLRRIDVPCPVVVVRMHADGVEGIHGAFLEHAR